MIRGKVIHIGQMMEGVSKTKGTPWRKQEYVLETDGQYPATVAFSLMNDKINQASIQMGNVLEVDVDARSREYNGKWYTELTAWRVKNLSITTIAQHTNGQVYNASAPQGYSAAPQGYAPQGYAPQEPSTTSNGDPLPF